MIDRSDVPAGYAVERERDAIVVALPSVLAEVRAHVRAHGTLYAAAAAAADARAFTGRAPAYRMRSMVGDWLVRRYHRGGAVARVLRDEYLRIGMPRPLAEMRTSAAARARNVQTPEVMAFVLYPAGLMYRADIATHFVTDAADLADVSLGGAAVAEITSAWRAAAVTLRGAFAAGLVHVDLNLRNLLVQRERVWLLDLDRAVVMDAAVNDAARKRMLERLHRSRRKLERTAGRTVPAEALRAFEEELKHE